MTPFTFYGVCFDSKLWGGDVTGFLVVQTDTGWAVVESHISTNESFSRTDIKRHFDRRDDELRGPGGYRYEWLGQLGKAEMEERFGWTGAKP